MKKVKYRKITYLGIEVLWVLYTGTTYSHTIDILDKYNVMGGKSVLRLPTLKEAIFMRFIIDGIYDPNVEYEKNFCWKTKQWHLWTSDKEESILAHTDYYPIVLHTNGSPLTVMYTSAENAAIFVRNF